MKKSLEIIEKICIAGIVVLLIIIVVGVHYLWSNHGTDMETETNFETEEKQITETESEEELSSVLEFMPDNLFLGEKPELNFFQDAKGNQVDLQKEYEGKIKVLIYWGSWCSYCEKTLQSLKRCSDLLKDYSDVEVLLLNKTDAGKDESVEKADSYLTEQNLDFPCFYDQDLIGYQTFGIKRIPTILVLDEQGYVRNIVADTIESGPEWKALLDQAEYGSACEIFQELEENWMGEDGQVYTEKTASNASHPSGHDVLSESLGVMMEYAVFSENRELFEKMEGFLQQNLERDHVYAWYLTEDGKQADANALLDDLRIYHALAMANDLWDDQEESMQLLADGIMNHNTKEEELYSFYDFAQKASGREISLSYIDFQTLELLGDGEEAFTSITSNMKNIVDHGYISDEFPLYYASYDYKKDKYSRESLHTAEALLTLYHLAQSDELKETSREWLRGQLSGNGLYARYETDGAVSSGYEYESPAVYAIAALTGIEANDAEIYTKAIQRMELLMEQNTETKDMRVFDLLMPMLAYARGNNVQFH